MVVAASLLLGLPVPAQAATPDDLQGPALESVVRHGSTPVTWSKPTTWLEVVASDPSGIANVRVVVSPEPGVADRLCSSERPGLVDPYDGTWTVPLCGFSNPGQPGRRIVERIILDDKQGNQSIIEDRNILDPLGYTVENEHYDIDPPELVSASASPEVVKPGSDVEVTLTFRDKHLSDEIYYTVEHGPGPEYTTVGSDGYRNGRKVVNHGDGTLSVIDTYKTDKYSPYGDYPLGPVRAHDTMGNSDTVDTGLSIRIDDPAHPAGPVSMSGSGVVGTQLEAVAAGWDPEAILEFQWKDAWGSTVLGSGQAYAPAGSVAGGWIRVWVTGTWADGTTRKRHSDSYFVHKGTLALGGVRISGTPAVGSALTASHQMIDPAKHPNPVYAYHGYVWQRDGKDIAGESLRVYVPTAADLGHEIGVRVTSNAPGYIQEITSSSTVRVVAGTMKAPVPAISGAAGVGSKYTADPGSWAEGATLSYQWLRNGTPISNATARTYTSTAADLNQVMQVSVSGTKAGYETVVATSAPKRPVTGLFAASTPRIAGVARVGSKLAAEIPVSWVPSATPQYQWLRNGKSIKGATGKTYTPVVADLAQKVSVRVSASKSGYTTMVRTSAAKKIAKGILKEGTLRYIGTKKVGTTMKAQPVGWGAGNTYSYQWKRNGDKIRGATKSSYKLQRADRGRAVSVTLTVKRSGYTTVIIGDGTFAAR